MCRRTAPKFGYKVLQSGSGPGYINTMQQGADDLLYLNSTGPTTLADLQARYNGVKAAGGVLVYFFHEFVASGASGTAVLTSDYRALLDAIKADVTAGLVDVMTPSELVAAFST